LKAQINKTDRNDARGIAQMMRAGLYRPSIDRSKRTPQFISRAVLRSPEVSRASGLCCVAARPDAAIPPGGPLATRGRGAGVAGGGISHRKCPGLVSASPLADRNCRQILHA